MTSNSSIPPSAGAFTPTAAVRPQQQIESGVRAVLEALRRLSSDRELRKAALVPTLWTLIGATLMAMVIVEHGKETSELKAWAIAFAAATSLPPTILFPLWVRFGLRARVSIGASNGNADVLKHGYVRNVVGEWMKAIRQLVVVSAGLAPLFFLMQSILPGTEWVYLALSTTWAFYWVILDALELPIELSPRRQGEGEPTWFERSLLSLGAKSIFLRPFAWLGKWAGRLSKPWRHAVTFTEQHPYKTAGFALAAGTVLLVPVLGVFFRAVAISAGTDLIVGSELEEADLQKLP